MTTKQFKKNFEELGNSGCCFRNGELVTIYNLTKKKDDKFHISYHLEFPQKNVQFNFWYSKKSYLNAKPSVTISFYNGNETNKLERLKNIFTTDSATELENELYKIIAKWRR